MTNDQVHTALNQWIRSKTGNGTIIKAHQGGTAPTGNYIMTNFLGSDPVRRHEIEIEFTDTGVPNSEGELIVTAAPVIEMEWRFSVHAYGTSPTDRLRPIVSAMKMLQPMEPLVPGLHIHEISQIRNVPDWINNAWQPRAQMDLFVRGIIRDSVGTVDVIDEYSLDIAPAE
ncbi:MAG: LIC_12616 family protein [Allorhizobium sp.]